MNKNKGDAGNIAGFINLENITNMKNNTSNQNKFQYNSRRELLEQTKLSRLPQRQPYNPVVVNAVCVGCGGQLERDCDLQQSVRGCRKCMGICARIDAEIEESAKRKTKELLEKFAGGVK